MIKIAHICDIHIALKNEMARGINVRANFEQVLPVVNSETPDLIILGGDLAAVHGEIDAYQWIKSKMDPLGIPYLIMAGNHDLVENMISVFGSHAAVGNSELYYTKELDGKLLIFLDSSSEKVSSAQFEWLLDVSLKPGEEALLFIHHPPTACGCVFMDGKYPLQNQNETMSVLNQIENIRSIFCGHYHTEKTVIAEDKTIFITPSTMMQLNQTNPEYEVSSFRPGWRIIDWDGSRIETRVDYLPESSH